VPDIPQDFFLRKFIRDESTGVLTETVKVSLHYGEPTKDGLYEISDFDGSYAAQSVIGSKWTASIGSSGYQYANNVPISFPAITVTVAVTHAAIKSTGGGIIAYAALDRPIIYRPGDVPTFAAGLLVFAGGPNLSDTAASYLLTYILKSSTSITTAPIYVGLHAGALGADAAGEITGGSYIRKQAAIANWGTPGTYADGNSKFALTYNAILSWANLPTCSIARPGFYSAVSGTSSFLFWGEDFLVPVDVTAGQTLTIASGDLRAFFRFAA
jgi:hypothetical protein